MRVLLAGAWQYEMYENAFARALKQIGIHDCPFNLYAGHAGLVSKFEHKYSFYGINTRRSLRELTRACEDFRPDVLLIWLGAGVRSETLKSIKRSISTRIVGYVHDDPFAHLSHGLSPSHHRYHWSPFIKALPIYDLVLFAKKLSADDALMHGAKATGVLPQYFVPWIHRHINLSDLELMEFRCDIAFAGHFEPDGRDVSLLELAKAGLKIRLYKGGLWERSRIHRSRQLEQAGVFVGPAVRGDYYASALSGADVSLCFMSKMNRDPYTTRCFEIPACGSLLLSERTPELQLLFNEDAEAVFFSSIDELVDKAKWLRSNPELRACIAAAGQRKVHAGCHSVLDRAAQFIDLVGHLC